VTVLPPVRDRSKRPRVLVPVSLMLLAGVLAGCGSTSSRSSSAATSVSATGASTTPALAPVTIKVGYQPDLHGAGVLDIGLADHAWQRFGINLDMVQFSSGPTEMQAMAGGDIQFGYLGPGAIWLPATGHGTIITVDSLETGDWVIGQPSITSLADLKGKRVGYAPGTSGEMILRLALQRAGLTMQDVDAVSLDADSVVPAFLSHHLDAVATWVPLTAAISQTEPQAHFLVSDADFTGQYEFPDVWVASRSEVASHPDVVTRFLEGFALANDDRLSHTAQTISLVANQAGVPAAGLAAQNKATVWIPSATLSRDYANGTAAGWIGSVEQVLTSMGKLPQFMPVSQFTSFNLYPHPAARAGS
jgi:sulfonate transport system substrate-binding protein